MKLALFVHILLLQFAVFQAASKIRKMIDFIDEDAPDEMKKVPNYNEESIGFQRNKKFDPCKENPKVCLNMGKCVPKDGNFYCQCPLTHYGKVCENIADQTNCEENVCQNNSTCVSTPNERRIVNTALLKHIRAGKSKNKELSEKELASVSLNIQYECICRPGFFGVLCDVTEEDRKCEEDYCLSRGKGKIIDGKCTCDCEKQYFGDRCEQISVCYETSCMNGAFCEDIVDEKQRTITAQCRCPEKIEFVDGKISGEFCENLEIFEETTNPKFIPCHENGNSEQLFYSLIYAIDLEYLEDVGKFESIRDSYGGGQENMSRLVSGWCENGGKCVPELVRLDSNLSYYLPRCDCIDPLTEGHFCEHKRENACSLTKQELVGGMKIDEKCTDITHGKCVDKNGKAICLCEPDYIGEKCEIFDPCAKQPCSHGDCIPMSSSSRNSDSANETNYQCLCPLSAKLENGTECITINEGKCRDGMCGNGRCMPCELPDDFDFMPLCSEMEQKQGFRCICEAGFIPPFCRVHSNPCWNNLCENNSTCQENQQKSYDCQCINGTSGTLCENVDDACEAFGEKTCVHGDCIDDIYYQRGFSCQCHFGFEGLNCDVELSSITANWKRAMKYYNFAVPLMVCIPAIIIVVVLIVFTRKTPSS